MVEKTERVDGRRVKLIELRWKLKKKLFFVAALTLNMNNKYV